jgi:hypothetical protein
LNQGKDEDVVFWVYTPDSIQEGTWKEPAERNIKDVVGSCDPMSMILDHLCSSTDN